MNFNTTIFIKVIGILSFFSLPSVAVTDYVYRGETTIRSNSYYVFKRHRGKYIKSYSEGFKSTASSSSATVFKAYYNPGNAKYYFQTVNGKYMRHSGNQHRIYEVTRGRGGIGHWSNRYKWYRKSGGTKTYKTVIDGTRKTKYRNRTSGLKCRGNQNLMRERGSANYVEVNGGQVIDRNEDRFVILKRSGYSDTTDNN